MPLNRLRAGTVGVADLDASRQLYERYLGYCTVETGAIAPALAEAWGTPRAAGSAYAVLQPVSGADVYLRFVESSPVAGFVPLVTYGWAALEFCVTDVIAVAERLRDSPFTVLGEPRPIDGLDGIQAMQIQGPDGEVCYLTQIDADPPGFYLPRARSLVDRLFITVLAASDMAAAQRWMVRHLGIVVGRAKMEIAYTMLANAFGTSPSRIFTVSTMADRGDVFLQVDQMPCRAGPRPRHEGQLPPGIAITTLLQSRIDAGDGSRIATPSVQAGRIYDGRRSFTLAGPDGTLFEVVEVG